MGKNRLPEGYKELLERSNGNGAHQTTMHSYVIFTQGGGMEILESTPLSSDAAYLQRISRDIIMHVIELTPEVRKIISNTFDPKATLFEMGYI